ncbi:MAG TPA: NADH-quinone oxidoreductase subunit K [Candidatus Limnocylindria bacterium]|nr:NADH-quinone oxidoreductase subunit K [Candidatus Limnocylindria bacterium]
MIDATTVVDALAVALLAAALASVAMRGLVAGVWLLVVQSTLLALVAATIAVASGVGHMWAAAGLTLAVRAIAVPAVLFLVLGRVALRREMRPILTTRVALLAGVGLTLVAFSAAGRLELSAAYPAPRALPVSLSLTFIGVLLMATRRKAISQLIGLITVENGIFLSGLIATLGLPLFVEIGIFFDLLVAVGVTAVLTMRINEHFDTVNTDALRRLRG